MTKDKKIEEIKLHYDGEDLETVGLSYIFALEEKLNQIIAHLNKQEK